MTSWKVFSFLIYKMFSIHVNNRLELWPRCNENRWWKVLFTCSQLHMDWRQALHCGKRRNNKVECGTSAHKKITIQLVGKLYMHLKLNIYPRDAIRQFKTYQMTNIDRKCKQEEWELKRWKRVSGEGLWIVGMRGTVERKGTNKLEEWA